MKQLESKSMVLLRHHLKALRLPTIGAECEKVARRAASDGSDHLTYLLQVTELELLERERKAAERRTRAVRVHRSPGERAVRRQPRDREEPPGDRPCRRGLRQGLPGAVLPG